MFNGAGLKNWA